MGNEVLYCSACGSRLLTTDFTRGRAHTVDRKSYCAACMAKPLARPAAVGKRPGTARSAAPAGRSPGWPWGIAVGSVAVVAVGLLLLLRPSAPALEAPIRQTDPRESAARRLLSAAEAFGREHPLDLAGQSARWQEAVRAADGTALAGEARAAAERVERARREAFKLELAKLEDVLAAKLGREEFRNALDAVEQAKRAAAAPEDGLVLDRRAQEIRDRAKALVPAATREAAAAARSADPALLKSARERLARWDLPELAKPVEVELNRHFYRPPTAWKGNAAGKVEGNPARAEDASWTAYQIWPDDPSKAEDYILMAWDGRQWKATSNTHGDDPYVQISGPQISLGFKGAWNGNPGFKTPAVAFAAPALGTYVAEATVTMEVWEGGPPVVVRAFKVDRSSQTVQQLAEVKLENKSQAVPFMVEARLDRGQELAIVVHATRFHTDGKVLLDQLLVSRTSD